MFIYFGQKGCYLIGQCCPVCPLKVNEGLYNSLLSYKQLCEIYGFTAMSNKIKTSACNVLYLIDKYQYFGRICCCCLQGRRIGVKASGYCQDTGACLFNWYKQVLVNHTFRPFMYHSLCCVVLLVYSLPHSLAYRVDLISQVQSSWQLFHPEHCGVLIIIQITCFLKLWEEPG